MELEVKTNTKQMKQSKKKLLIAFKSHSLTTNNTSKIIGGTKTDLIIDDLSGIIIVDEDIN